ncbi:hypothetical protein [Sphingosinicella xenopeptidilytica]|uniref:Uncharacterized protein n=1 Tax=Sphingosinicella xenopeptidilytica TaxID=364098 RepID=A0ABW3C235_SPHXN
MDTQKSRSALKAVSSTFALFFLALVVVKVLLIGDDSLVSRLILPGLIVVSVAGMVLFEEKRVPLPVETPALSFLAAVFVFAALNGALFQGYMATSIQALLKIVTMAFVFAGSYLATLRGWGQATEKCILVIISLHVILGLVLTPFGVGFEIGGTFRPTGITGRPQLLANIATLGALYAALFLTIIRGRNTTIYFTMFAVCLLFVVFSATLKNALTLLAFGTGIFLVRAAKRSISAVIVALVFVAIFAALITLGTGLGDRLLATAEGGLRLEVARGEELESSLIWRILHWRLLFVDWYQHYFWTGSGLGAVVHMRGLTTSSGDGFAAHSDWVGFFVELGPVLLLLFLVGIFRFWGSLSPRCADERQYAIVTRILLALFVIMAAAGNVFYSAAFQYLFWIIAGQSAAYRWLIRDNSLLAPKSFMPVAGAVR